MKIVKLLTLICGFQLTGVIISMEYNVSPEIEKQYAVQYSNLLKKYKKISHEYYAVMHEAWNAQDVELIYNSLLSLQEKIENLKEKLTKTVPQASVIQGKLIILESNVNKLIRYLSVNPKLPIS